MAAAMETHITTSACSEWSIGCGASRRCTAWTTRKMAEAQMKAPWVSPASGSALPWPKRCSASAGDSASWMANRLSAAVNRSSALSAMLASIATELDAK